MTRYGGDIGHLSRRTMLLKILPPDMRQDINRRPDLVTIDDIIADLRKQSAWDRSELIIKNASKKGSVSAVMPEQAPHRDVGHDAPTVVNTELVHAVVAALSAKGNGKGRNPKSEGSASNRTRSNSLSRQAREAFPKDTCYHCKEKGHSRTAGKTNRAACAKFALLIKNNNGKLPEGYKGAFEKHLEEYKKKHGGGVNAVTCPDIITAMNNYVDSEDESSDDEPTMPNLAAIWNKRVCDDDCGCEAPPVANFERPPKKRTTRTRHVNSVIDDNVDFPMLSIPKPAVSTANAFAQLSARDDYPMLAIPEPLSTAATNDLKGWAHRVEKSSDKTIKKDRTWKIKTDEDVAKLERMLCSAQPKDVDRARRLFAEEEALDSLTAAINRKSSKPETCAKLGRKVWAMVDSGSFVTIANCRKHFGPEFKVKPSAGSRNSQVYSNASGGEIKNRGETTVIHVLDDGSNVEIPFQDADVAVPIISVKDFVVKDSVVKFKQRGGTIKLPDGRQLGFQERHGVYFILLNIVPPDDDLDPSLFARPAP